MHATYLIPRENETAFTKAIDKLAKKAKKLGLAAITYVAIKTLSLERDRLKVVYTEVGDTTEVYKATVEHVAYTIEGEAPTLAGWEFVATLEHEGNVTILRVITDGDIPKRFRNANPADCDHCGYVRDRKDTFVVRNVETDEYKQVGRSCLKDFLGNANPGSVAAYATTLRDFLENLNGGGFEEEGEQKGIPTYNLIDFLAATGAAISEHGWMSRSQAKEQYQPTMATADVVLGHFETKDKAQKLPGVGGNLETAKDAIAWAESQEPANDYLHNLQVICELGYVTCRTAGYAASIMSGFYRAEERRLYLEGLKTDGTDHVGTVGKRAEMLLTLIAVHHAETRWGTTSIHKFVDSHGNPVTWFASNDQVVPEGAGHEADWLAGQAPMAKGATYRVKATVKDHGEYKGQPQTVVTRVTVQPVAKPPKKSRRKTKTQEASA